MSNYAYYSEIKKVDFYILGSEENYLDSTTSILSKELFKNDIPVQFGVYDSSMGTTEYNWICNSCFNPKGLCPGHSGSLDLNYPVKSPLFRDTILKWLKIICFKCGRLIYTKDVNAPSNKILMEYVRLSKGIDICPWDDCKEEHPNVIKDKYEQAIFYAEYKSVMGSVKKEELYNHIIKNILNKISDETILKLKKPLKCHPKKLILDIIRVAPNTIRPDIRRIGGSRSNNSDITALTKNIVEINELLPPNIPPIREITKELREMYFNLDITYYELVKGSSASGNHVRLITTTNKAPSSIASRIPKKKGRVRNNLMGKRTTKMMRSVITGDNSLKVDEIGIPKKLAMSLQIPEVVRSYNIEKLKIYYMNKRNTYPGCSGIHIKGSNKFHRIEHLDPEYELQEGDIIMRDLIEGDFIGFNRQPSLLFGNIGSHKIKIMEKGSTIRINVSACSPYNADFDGDAANALIAQNIQSRTELQKMSWIGNWMISYQNHSPYFGCFQDSLIGSAELTRSDIKMDKWHAMQLFSNIIPDDGKLNFDRELYTGRQLIGKFLPKINYPKKKSTIYLPQYTPYIKYDPDEIYVQINRGELISGTLDKSIVGQKVMGSIFHIINNEYGANKALETIYNFHQIVSRFFLWRGFTVGIKDINISEEAMLEIKKKTEAMKEEAKLITEKLDKRELIPPLGMTLRDYYENEQINALEPADNFVTPILNDIDFKDNKMARLIFTGSKGKKTNLININGSYGQININGKRPVRNFSWGRTSPYFLRYDMSPNSLGFIDSSYREGITSNVFPFAASDARFSSISNALSTSVSGAQSRISIKNLESILINNLRQCAKGENIIQLLYADSGVDVRKTEAVKFLTIMITDKEMEEQYKSNVKFFNKEFHNENVQKELDEEYKQLIEDRETYRSIFINSENNNPGRLLISNMQQMPVNPYRIIEDAIYNYSDVIDNVPKEDSYLDPILTIKRVKNLCDSIAYVYFNSTYEENKFSIPEYIEKSLTLLNILIRSYLCTSNLIKKKITNFHLKVIINKIKITLKNSLVDYGAAVGIIAAQCLSEPLTQYVLDSKHRSGGGGGTQVNVVERIKEIFGAKDTDKMKVVSMSIMVKEEYENNKQKVQEIANYIEMMNFEKFIYSEKVFFEKYGEPIHPDFIHEKEIIKQFEKNNLGMKIPNNLSNFCIRYELNKEELIINNMKLDTIITKLRINFPDIYFVYTPENADILIIRCYFPISLIRIPSSGFNKYLIIDFMKKINETVIRGIKGITSTEVVSIAKSIILEDGSITTTKIFGINTIGSNLEEVLENSYIDPYRTQTNSIVEFEKMYGIEAARKKIISEIIKTMSSDDVIIPHCSIFADEMCYSGYMTSIQKTGLQIREMNNITLRLSFQSPIQVIENAAVNGIIDNIHAISGPLILGQSPRVGTTYNNVAINEEFVKNNMKKSTLSLEDEL